MEKLLYAVAQFRQAGKLIVHQGNNNILTCDGFAHCTADSYIRYGSREIRFKDCLEFYITVWHNELVVRADGHITQHDLPLLQFVARFRSCRQSNLGSSRSLHWICRSSPVAIIEDGNIILDW